MPEAISNPRRQRRTQLERTAATRAKLLAATLDLVVEKGLRDTTTTMVAERAGVSRGALLHHFPNKNALIQEAHRTMLVRMTDDIHGMAAAIDDGRIGIDGFLDAIWEMFSGRPFAITLDYVVAARTDPDTMATLRPIAAEYNEALDAIWDRFFIHSRLDRVERRQALNATLCLLRGMGVQRVWREEPAFFDDLLVYWKRTVLATILAPAGAADTAPPASAGRPRAQTDS